MNQSTVFMLTLGVGTTGLLAYFCYKNSYPVDSDLFTLTHQNKNKPSIDNKSANLVKSNEIEQEKSLFDIFIRLIY